MSTSSCPPGILHMMGVLSNPPHPYIHQSVPRPFPFFIFFCRSSTSVNYTKLKPKNKGGNDASDTQCQVPHMYLSTAHNEFLDAETPQSRTSRAMEGHSGKEEGDNVMLCTANVWIHVCPDWNQYSRVLHL